MIKILIVDIMVRVGSFLCTTAIKISGQGYVDIEVTNRDYTCSLMFDPYVRSNPAINTVLKYLFFSIFIGITVWTGLELALYLELFQVNPNYQMENNIF